MNDYVKQVTNKRIEKTIKNLGRNNMLGYHAADNESLLTLLDELVPDGSKVGFGGSFTLDETGVMNYLKNRDINLLDRNAPGLSPEEIEEVMRSALNSDVFITSTNALTEDGILFNVDGRGNRVAAMIYGPKSVIVIAGYNKIVSDIDQAIDRVRKKAAPANTMRLELGTPCVKTGECMDCRRDDRICCSYVTLAQQRVKDRIKVIILDESFGF